MDLLKVFVIDKMIKTNANKSLGIQSTKDSIVRCSSIEWDVVVCNGESGSSNVKSISPNVKRKLVEFWEKELANVGQDFIDVNAF